MPARPSLVPMEELPCGAGGRSDPGAGAASAGSGSTWEMIALGLLAAPAAPADTKGARSFLAVLPVCRGGKRHELCVLLGIRKGYIRTSYSGANSEWNGKISNVSIPLCDSSLGHAKLYSITFFFSLWLIVIRK